MSSKHIAPTIRLADLLAWLCLGIMCLLPFHTFFTTWAGASFGHLDVFRIWKELLLTLIVLGCSFLLLQDTKLRSSVQKNLLTWLIVIYGLLHLVLGLYAYQSEKVNAPALLYALMSNLRYFAFFGATWIIAQKSEVLKRYWAKMLFLPAALVIIFGILQAIVLPVDFLKHFGYGPNTVQPYQSVDLKPDYARVQATLRGANPLGAYLVVVLTAVTAMFLKKRNRLFFSSLLIGGLLVLFYTYSRSSWLGLALSLMTFGYLLIGKKRLRSIALVGSLFAVIVFSGLFYLLRDNNSVQNVVLHTDETSVSTQSSNDARARALKAGANDVLAHPLGGGPGTAGPASARNTNASARIAENYYIQIAQEVGIAGLVLYACISSLVFYQLWQRRTESMSLILLASFIGLSFVNLLLHAWADDTLGLLWWGLAGIALSPGIIHKQNGKKEKRT